MSLNITIPLPPDLEFAPRITVIGIGGAGCNAVNNMIRSNLTGVNFIVTNTDAQALASSLCETRIQLGTKLTAGLGAGSRPEVGKAAAEEALDQIVERLDGIDMVFITSGMGGGTGTGAAPVIARAARERNILTVGVVTKPFSFEGKLRLNLADQGILELQQYVDTLIVIPNQNLFRLATERTTFADAFRMADDVLHSGVRGVTDLMLRPGLINLDFADIRTAMGGMGKAMMGTGEASGERRALDAAEAAISNPLLEDTSMRGARGVLINITGGLDMTLFEVDGAANRIREEIDGDANIIFGASLDESLEGRIRVSVVATGLDTVSSSLQFACDRVRQEQAFTGSVSFEEDMVEVVDEFNAKVKHRQVGNVAVAPRAMDGGGGRYDSVVTNAVAESVVASDNINLQRKAAVQPNSASVVSSYYTPFIPAQPADTGSLATKQAQPNPASSYPVYNQQLQRPTSSEVFSDRTVRDNTFHRSEISRTKSFIQRITGVGRNTSPAMTSAVSHKQPYAYNLANHPKQQPIPGQMLTPEEDQRSAQPSGSNDHNDDYDIPAFLRRQAN